MNQSTQTSSLTRIVMVCTSALWALATVVYAYMYVASHLALPGAVGYERDWSWQLFFFALVRLPMLLLALGAVLWLEYLLLSPRRATHRVA